MSSDILRAAADRLDELAGAATPGPWKSWPGGTPIRTGSEPRHSWEIRADLPANAAYIAPMHPEVGKALAAWLRAEAQNCDESVFFADCTAEEQESWLTHPLAVARLILGGSDA